MTPTNSTDALDLCRRVAERVKRDGGRALLVGGAVRDKVMGLDPKDFDLEIYGVQPDDLERLLGEFGRVDAVGKSFGVLKLTVDGRTMDISTPRRESKEGRGHRGFIATPDPSMTVEDALRRRDFTMNAMAEDPLTGEFFDPFRGKDDIAAGIIRAVDARTFPDDPLRVLRAAQFSSRLDFFVEPLTAMYCQGIVESGEVATLPRERIGEEWRKLLLGKNPSRGMLVLKNAGALRVLHPELNRLDIVPQDPKWHQEGWLLSSLTKQSPLIPSEARAAQTVRIDGGLRLRDFFSAATTRPTMIPTRRSAPSAQSVEDAPTLGFAVALPAGAHSTGTAVHPDEAVVAQPESFMWAPQPAVRACEVVRVVFQVPLSEVVAEVGVAINDFEVIRRVVHTVAVYVMNVFPPLQGSTELQFHDDSVDAGRSVLAGPRRVCVSRVVVDAGSASVDGYILFDFDLSVVDDDDPHMGECTPTRHLLQVKRGSVWDHTLLAVKAARPLAEALPEESRLVVMLATLLHDVGKLTTTARKDDGGISSIGHEDVGAEMALRVMTEQMLVDADTAKKVVRIVAEHLVPKFFYKDKVNDAAVRRLARRLEPASIEDLCAVARADSLGRIPAKGLEPEDWLEARARDMKVERQGPQPILMGRHLIERGWTPGKEMGDALRRVFEMQLDGRVTTLDHALGAVAAAGAVPVSEPSLKGAP